MIVSAPFYWLTCDACGVKSTEQSEHVAYSDVDGAVAEAEESEWLVTVEGGHFCYEHRARGTDSADEAQS